MIQVPSNYEARSESVPSTDDHKPPSKTKTRQRQQQRPIVPRRIPTARKPAIDGQSKKVDNARQSTRDEPVDRPITVQDATVANDVAGYRRVTRNNIKRSMNAKSVRITNVSFKRTHHGGALVYEFRTGEGIRGTWSVEVPKHQMAKLERELKAKLKKTKTRSFAAACPTPRRGMSHLEKKIDWSDPDMWGRSLDAIGEQLADDMVFINAAALVFTGFDKTSVDERAALTELFLVSHVDAWAISSADTSNNLHYLQLAAIEEFGLPRSLASALDRPTVTHLRSLKRYPTMIAGYRQYLRAQYNVTQEFLRRKRVKVLQLSKGAAVRRPADGPSNATWTGETAVGTIGTQPLTSYTADDDGVAEFILGRSNAVHVRQEVPADRVYALYPTGLGDPSEFEVVIIGHNKFKCEHTTWRFASVTEGGTDG
jgi:hypothetical protein